MSNIHPSLRPTRPLRVFEARIHAAERIHLAEKICDAFEDHDRIIFHIADAGLEDAPVTIVQHEEGFEVGDGCNAVWFATTLEEAYGSAERLISRDASVYEEAADLPEVCTAQTLGRSTKRYVPNVTFEETKRRMDEMARELHEYVWVEVGRIPDGEVCDEILVITRTPHGKYDVYARNKEIIEDSLDGAIAVAELLTGHRT